MAPLVILIFAGEGNAIRALSGCVQERAPSSVMGGVSSLFPMTPVSASRSSGRGSKAAYTDKQKRQAEHIEKGYEHRGVGKREAEKRAWATVNKISGGGKKSGSGRGKATNKASMRKGGRKGGAH